MLFAAAYPERTSALILYGTFATMKLTPHSPWGMPAEAQAALIDSLVQNWDKGLPVEVFAPSRVQDTAFCDYWGRSTRASTSLGDVPTLWRAALERDLTPVLPTIRVPTLVLHRNGDRAVPIQSGRDLAARIPGAKFVELTGSDHLTWTLGNSEAVVDQIEDFLTGSHHQPEPDRILTTVMFADIADSTGRAAQLGDAKWRELLQRYYHLVTRTLEHYRGRQVTRSGDGILASFDGPARAIRCALAINQAVEPLGLDLRAGIHTGECELIDNDLSGISVHIGARVCALAEPRETLISGTVKDLVAGSDLKFVDRGIHSLRGVPGEWRLYAAN